MAKCRKRSDWAKWEETIQSELASLTKREVFMPMLSTPPSFFPVGYKWVFVPKRNENNDVVRYKARLVAQRFTQRAGINFNETYSPVMSGITFPYLISLAVQKHLSMQLMDVVTAYLYGSLDSNIYIYEGSRRNYHTESERKSQHVLCKLKKSLYGLKQSGRMWYNRLSEFLLKKGYTSSDDSPYVFINVTVQLHVS
jgi:hypothetical protein